jgi:hypothetical protein
VTLAIQPKCALWDVQLIHKSAVSSPVLRFRESQRDVRPADARLSDTEHSRDVFTESSACGLPQPPPFGLVRREFPNAPFEGVGLAFKHFILTHVERHRRVFVARHHGNC